MKKILAFVFAAVMALCVRGEVRWLGMEHNFGAFDEDDGKVSCTFMMVNKGPEEVSVRSAQSSCGCTMPSYTKGGVMPGDTAKVSVSYNPVGRPGRFSKTVRITLSDGSRHTLTVKGVVIGSQNTLRSRYPVSVGSLKLRSDKLLYGSVVKGRAKSCFMEVYNASQKVLTPRIEGLPEYMSATPSADTVAPGEQLVYTMRLTPSKTELYGVLTDSFAVVDPLSGLRQPVYVAAILEEDFSGLTPAQMAKAPVIEVDSTLIDLGRIQAGSGEVIRRRFTITNRGEEPLLLRRVYSPDAALEVRAYKMKIKKGKSATVEVAVDPGKISSELLNARIQVISNDPAASLTVIRVTGEL